MTLIDTIAQRIASGPSSDAMASAAPTLSIHVLDTVGAWIAGRATREGRHLYGLREGSVAIRKLFDSSFLDNVSLLTATTRLTEVDDIHMGSCTTPGALVVMTALAADAASGSLYPDCFTEVLHVGYEVMTCLGEAVSGSEILHQGVWPSLLLAPITTAAIMSKHLNLDAERTAHALSIALTSSNGRPGGNASAGVTSTQGTSARWLLFGMAARMGCLAAMSAAAGFTGDRALLENDRASPMRGLPISHERIEAMWGRHPAVTETSIKPYCAAKHNMAAIHGFRQLLDRGIAHESLTKIRVRLPPSHANMVAHYNVETSRLSRITSCGYNLALMGVSPDDLLDIERAEPFGSGAMARLAGKIEVVADARLAATSHAYPAAIDLFVGDETIASETIFHAWGDPEVPFRINDVKRKFHRLTRDVLAPSEALEIERLCLDVPRHPSARATLLKHLAGIDRRQSTQGGSEVRHLQR
ncbi:2-methylcitrate dehydratase PrpD [Robbsia andropogonis]|uniref:MmgE/PrpD family protein n=1 Tax=Robbsia andropogonis TaxID=28092 RepID=UPI00209D9A74|nr:MmgE/PrpD family protein [Robbsia andropogonis]MCP1120213.1 MmgE/PrpD family protein [Robbsia andropogonis]MCP1130141.1 MmgE/PrpD family protein [Robbsia andropogonis]